MDTQKFIDGFNAFVKVYLVWWFYIMAVIELVALALRAKGIHVQLVSQVAREVAFKGLPTMAYFMSGMAAHWFITWRSTPWDGWVSAAMGLVFWGVGVAYLLADIFDPNFQYWPIVTQWLRYPPVVASLGFILALICFPQESVWFPGAR